jgi:hypothetical protein
MLRKAFKALSLLFCLALTLIAFDAGAQTHETHETSYLPDVAGPGSTIVATFNDPDATGPSGTATIAFEDASGHRSYVHAATNALHKVVFKVAPGAVAVWLASAKTIISRDATVNGTDLVANIPQHGPAIERAATAYERGGASQGIFNLQTRAIDPLHAEVLVDGRSTGTDTLAASDRSIKARFASDEPLGRHVISVRSGHQRTNGVKADLVTLRADPVPPGGTGSVRTLRVHVDGLPRGDRAIMSFHIAGSARLENGEENATVPVQDGIAEVRIRGEHAGEAIVQFGLHAALDVLADEASGSGGPPTTTTRETPGPGLRPPPTPTPTPLTPGDIDKPAIYGHDDYSCQTRVLDAWMEPTQGVWQDDPIFPDQGGKQLVRDKNPNRILYHAELPLVARRDTVLGGVLHYEKNGKQVNVHDRNHIVFKLRTNCTRDLEVHFHFEVSQIGIIIDEWNDENVLHAPLLGAPSNTPRIVELSIPAENGVPRSDTFAFKNTLFKYLLTAKIEDEHGNPTGLRMDVDGDVVPSFGFSVHFVPVIVSPVDATAGTAALLTSAGQLGTDNTKWVNDYYPERPGNIRGVLEPTQNLTSTSIPDVTSWQIRNHTNAVHSNRNQSLLDAINDRLSVQTMLEDAGRVVAVMTTREFYATFANKGIGAYTSRATAQSRGGTALNYKFIVEQWTDVSTETTAHELAHTLVPGWMDLANDQELPAMTRQCKTAQYHDVRTNWAFGLRLNISGNKTRKPINARDPIMSASDPRGEFWIAQCSYWLLQDVLRNVVPDPPLILVRGILNRNGRRVEGALGPEYDLRGIPSLTSRAGGQYNIVLKDASGATLASYSFTPIWRPPDIEVERNSFPFAFMVPAPNAQVREVDLYGRSGKLATFLRAAAAPVARLRSMKASAKRVAMSWDAPAGSLCTVLYAANGKDYITEAFETDSRTLSFKVQVARGLVKLIVTKDGRSMEVVRKL